MIDERQVRACMEEIQRLLDDVYKKTCEDGFEYDDVDVACLIARASGIAYVIQMQCEQEGKPTMRGAAE